MLVLTRKLGERIVIAGNIEIAVVRICGNKVRLGVTARRHVFVHRSEVRRQILADCAVNGRNDLEELNIVAPRSTPG